MYFFCQAQISENSRISGATDGACDEKFGAKKMAHNVSAVYDVLAARIRALRSKDQGRQNVAEVLRGNEQCE
jgi:hypothetical protein